MTVLVNKVSRLFAHDRRSDGHTCIPPWHVSFHRRRRSIHRPAYVAIVHEGRGNNDPTRTQVSNLIKYVKN